MRAMLGTAVTSMGERMPFTRTDPGQQELSSSVWGLEWAGRQGMTFLSLGLSITRGHLPWVVCKRVPRVGVQHQGGVEASVRFSC